MSRPVRATSLKVVAAYGGAVLLCLIVVLWSLQLWRADLSVPFNYLSCCGDVFLYSLWVKGIIDSGWYLENPWVGMPFGLQLHDYPRTELLHFLLIKLLSLFSHDWTIVVNLYFLLTFPLATLSALFVLRQFGVAYLPALTASLLFTFLPFHFFRGESHLFMSAYFLVPLMVMVIVRFALEHHLRAGDPGLPWYLIWREKKSQLLKGGVVCILVALSGVYDAFFASFFLLCAAVAAGVSSKRVAPALIAGMLIVLMTVAVIFTTAPTLLYQYRNGVNTEVARRSAVEAEIYGLKIAQMLLPVSGHRIGSFAAFKDHYVRQTPLVNENDSVTLGMVGSVGFLLLIGRLLYPQPAPASHVRQRLVTALSLFAVAAVLLATIGGFSSLFALLISPQIRAYNRISVYVSFLAMFRVAIWLDDFVKNAGSRGGQWARCGAVCALLPLGLLDLTTPGFIPDYAAFQAEYASDAAFVRRIESLVPAKAMIFQLPYVPFPESPPVEALWDYGLLRGYLHSTRLRWSYGAMRGRTGDLWQRQIAGRPLDQLVETVSLADFSGIYIDRYGYKDRGAAVEVELTKLLGNRPIVSENQRLVFFDLTAYIHRIRSQYTQAAWEARQDLALPILQQWAGGFSGLEGTAEDNWRWCAAQGELVLHNPSRRTRQVRLEMSFGTGYAENADLRIDGPGFSDRLEVNQAGRPFARTITVPPGQHRIRFTSNAKPVYAPADPRTLVFRIMNFRLQEHDTERSRT